MNAVLRVLRGPISRGAFVTLVSGAFFSCAHSPAPQPEALDESSFSSTIEELSEEGGYFWSNNYISNETSYLHVIDELSETAQPNRVYIGVGPNQNFTYIAHTRPHIAFIVDIRRQNLVEHLLFKSIMLRSETRGSYLSTLLARPLPADALSREAPIERIIEALENAPVEETIYEANLEWVQSKLAGEWNLSFTERDFQDLKLIYSEFVRQGLGIKYDSWRSFFFPSLKEFILETDRNGHHRNWLVRHEDYAYVRELQRTNRVVPLVGDFAGDKALRKLGELLRSRGETVSTFYVSNVEFYLFRQRKWDTFIDNVKELPIDDDSVFIRAYANLHRPHPQMVDAHITITLVQNIKKTLDNHRIGRYRNLWDVVTISQE